MSSLKETFLRELADVYDAEKQIIKALPKMHKAAQHDELKEAFEMHLEVTRGQVERLEKIFGIFGQPVQGKKCKGMQGIIEEGQERIKEKAGDAALICAAQKVEHYEIAAYGSLNSWAKLMQEENASDLLTETLDEERETDEKLTQVAESAINIEESEEGEQGQRGRKAA